MARTPTYDPGSTEARSPLIAGLTEAVNKISSILDMNTGTLADAALTEVAISDDDKNRIYQANMGQRLWLKDPAPVFKKNGEVITPETDFFETDYVGGSIAFDDAHRLLDDDVVTITCTYIVNTSKTIFDIKTAISDVTKSAAKYKGAFDTVDKLKSLQPTGEKGDFAIVLSEPSIYIWSGEEWVGISGSGEASKITYYNKTSGLSAINVQDAIDELAKGSATELTAETYQKFMDELPQITEINKDYLHAVTGGDGPKTISSLNMIRAMLRMEGISNDDWFEFLDHVADFSLRRNAPRCKNLGSVYTDEQKRSVQDRSFKGLFIGDYWEADENKWYIVDIDYFYGIGDTPCDTPHVVVMPETPLQASRFSAYTSAGLTDGFTCLDIWKTGLGNIKNTKIPATFINNILKHRELLSVSYSTDAIQYQWFDSELNIPMTIQILGCIPDKINVTISHGQFALFRIAGNVFGHLGTRDIAGLHAVHTITPDYFAFTNVSNPIQTIPYFCLR